MLGRIYFSSILFFLERALALIFARASGILSRMDAPAFPIFTPREHAADRVVHALGVAAAAVAVPLLVAIAASRGAATFSGVLAYGLGAVAMFVASALYNIAP